MAHHSFTNINDLYNENNDNGSGASSYKTTVTPLSTLFASAESKSRPPCEIRCTDILNHITMCPVCSKLYKEVEKNHRHQQQPQTNKENFLTKSDNSANLKTAVIVLAAILAIILLLWLRSKYMNNQGAKVAPFAPYMNRR